MINMELGDRKKKEWNDLWWFSVPVVEISVFNLFSKNKTRPTTAPSSVNLFRPWKCALLSPRIAGRWGIRPFVCHRLCKYTCVHTLASHNPLDCPCKFYTTQNRSWLLYLKSKRRIINFEQGNTYSSVPNRSPCAFIFFCLFSPACISYLGLCVY